MQLAKEERERLVQELRFAVEKMQVVPDHFSKLYFFSAAYGEIGRILNVTWDAELGLLHLVLQATYSTVNARFQAISSRRDLGVKIPDKFLEVLTVATSDLADMIQESRDDELPRILARFGELAYMTTGNGYYLYVKGLIRPKGL